MPGVMLLATTLLLWISPPGTRAGLAGLGELPAADRRGAAGLANPLPIADRRASGPMPRGGERGVQPLLEFFPIAGNLYRDIWLGNFVDLDPNAGVLDFDCTDYAANRHRGHDAGPRWFGEQLVGVPVFAAEDGTVSFTNDGQPDMNTQGSANIGNVIFIDNGLGRTTSYYHLKKDSVAVSVGQPVVAGQQIAMVGSSGNSFGPHLHFELDESGIIVEPFTGPCNPGPSGWTNQASIPRFHYIWDFGVTHEDLSTFPWWPNTFPREGQIAITDSFMEFWVLGAGLPANATWRVQFQRPDGVVTFDSGTVSFGNPDLYQWYLTWWHYDLAFIPDIQTTTGTWRILMDFDGQRLIDAPVEMRAARTPDFNRAPEPITVTLDPNAPTERDVLICRVSTDQVVDDRDYDIVQYHYVWRVNGAVVRDVTTAGQADMIPRFTAGPCDQVTCDVTPQDGIAAGPTATVSINLAPFCPGDTNGDFSIDVSDLGTLLANFGAAGSATVADGDTDCDGDVDVGDLGRVLAGFGSSCP